MIKKSITSEVTEEDDQKKISGYVNPDSIQWVRILKQANIS